MRRESVKDAWLVSFISLLFSSLFSYFFGCFVVLRFEVINFGLENLNFCFLKDFRWFAYRDLNLVSLMPQ